MEGTSKLLFYWLQKQRMSFEGCCCELIEFVKSVSIFFIYLSNHPIDINMSEMLKLLFIINIKPIVDSYRNKCEFTIGFNADESSNLFFF